MKEEIEKMYVQALIDDLPPNVFADQVLRLFNVVGRSEQLADHNCKPMVNADWTYLRCECGKRFEPKG